MVSIFYFDKANDDDNTNYIRHNQVLEKIKLNVSEQIPISIISIKSERDLVKSNNNFDKNHGLYIRQENYLFLNSCYLGAKDRNYAVINYAVINYAVINYAVINCAVINYAVINFGRWHTFWIRP